jgi:branched-chain amino acid transport system ATP-binding protein
MPPRHGQNLPDPPAFRDFNCAAKPDGLRGIRQAAQKAHCQHRIRQEKKETLAGDLPILSLKKLELARALARNPELLLLDEVAAGITEVEIPKVLATIQEIRRMGITVIIIEHVIKVLVNVVDRIVVIDKGTKIAEGPPMAVMNDCKVMEAYFGA